MKAVRVPSLCEICLAGLLECSLYAVRCAFAVATPDRSPSPVYRPARLVRGPRRKRRSAACLACLRQGGAVRISCAASPPATRVSLINAASSEVTTTARPWTDLPLQKRGQLTRPFEHGDQLRLAAGGIHAPDWRAALAGHGVDILQQEIGINANACARRGALDVGHIRGISGTHERQAGDG